MDAGNGTFSKVYLGNAISGLGVMVRCLGIDKISGLVAASCIGPFGKLRASSSLGVLGEAENSAASG
jgi:hypothetical protein